jgi:hypothetical protein
MFQEELDDLAEVAHLQLKISAVGLLPISLLVAGIVAQAHLSAMFVASGALVLPVGMAAALTSGVRQIE